ncbi:Disease resistance protein RPS2 [Rhynchospora pubera]|uniref:Disease resistance protein RPS2 n=1 Tax=Rhynchospora pubera TaxID=906938 RepID=A0AAV8G4D0_9POAL|nr:Disease resistance protein RPS2 [Rhynchospora pubera]
MADEIIGAVGQLCECLNSCGVPAAVAAEISSFFSIEDNWSSLQNSKEKLQALQTAIKNKVTKEKEKSRGVNAQVESWLRRVEVIILDKSQDEECKKRISELFSSCTSNIPQRHKLGKQITKDLGLVKDLIDEGNNFTDVGDDLPLDLVDPIPQAKTFGMESMLKQLNQYFEDHEKCIIGVWGQGGVGKTTLLTVFHNQLNGCGNFYVVILIDVSNLEMLDRKAIQHTIAERMGLPWVDTETEDARARLLMKTLAKRRFVILLDDVRKKFRLEEIGIPLPNTDNGSKIILASRDEDVCIQMGAQHSLIKMQLLDNQASWDLFFSNLSTDAQRSIHSSYSIKWRAEAIQISCQGLPLALHVTSRAVAGLKNPNDWRDAMMAINTGLSEIGGADEIFQPMKYSYDKLDATTKKCFLYCTLFPEHSSIRKEQLVEYWIAEGFIPPNEPWKGNFTIIKKLKSACLLQETNSELKVRLHNVLRQFGQWLANQETNFLIQSGKNLENAPEIEQWDGPQRISLMSNDIVDISFSPKCTNLETLLLQNNPNLSVLGSKFFKFMTNLKVLDLSNTGIKELPECDALHRLQHLNLSKTPISKLPRRFWVLKELRYLDLSLTEELEETYDNCSKLLKLRVLNLFRSNYGIRNVSDLNLDKLKELNFLGITICTEDVLKKLKKKHPLAKSTHRLSLNCPAMKSIHVTDFNQMEHLQELNIESCPELTELMMDQDEGVVSKLEVLTLWELPSLDTILVKSLPHYFKKLRELTIYECPKLENINWVARLESLDKLVVSRCNGMVHIIADMAKGAHVMQNTRDGTCGEVETEMPVDEASQITINEDTKATNEEVEENIEFPKLRSVLLTDLQNLVSICSPRKFPSLENIRVQECPNLVSLPISCEYEITKLRQIYGSSEWWNRLELDGKTRRSMENYFTAI